MNSKEKAELEVLFPGESYTLQNGEEIVVKPVTFGKLKVFIDAVSSLFLKLESSGITDIESPSAWPTIFSVAHGEVLNILMAVLNKDREWMDEVLSLPDGIHIFGMVVRQNVTEDLKKKFQDLGKVLRSAMPTSPSS